MPITDEQFKEYLKNPIMFPPAFKDWVGDWFATNVPKLHVSQIFGFKLQSMHIADDVPASETLSITAYGDLATAGPTLTNLSNGFYIVLWGCLHVDSSTNDYMSISADGDTPSGQREMLMAGAESWHSVGRVALVDFSQGDQTHTLQAKYKTSAGSTTLSNRWLHAMKVVTEDA